MRSATRPAKPAASIGKALSSPRRILVVWIVIVTLIALGGVIAVLAVGGRPDPSTLRAAAPLLDGAWRFHIGDDPHWANADADDSGWETMDLSAPASSHDGDVGLPNYVARMDGARPPRLSRVCLVSTHRDGAGRKPSMGCSGTDRRRPRLRDVLERRAAGRIRPAWRIPQSRRHAADDFRASRRCGRYPWGARHPGVHATGQRRQWGWRRHPRRADALRRARRATRYTA